MHKKPAIAIDLGGTKIKTGLVHGGVVFSTVSIDAHSDQGLAERLPHLADAVRRLMQQYALSKEDVSGLGMAVPGIVDSVQKRILSIDKKYGDAPGIDLDAWCRDTFGISLTLENDARSALVGEWQQGNAKGYDNVILMTLGTGVGSSAVVEGRLMRGKHFLAGIMGGHSIINYKGKLCNCGNIGCVETEASTWCIAAKAHAAEQFGNSLLATEPTIDYESIFRCAAKGDALAIQLRDDSLTAWSAAAINLVHAYDPEILLLSGGIMASSEQIIPFIQQYTSTYAWTPWGKVIVKEALFTNTAALIGAAHLVMNP